MFNIAVEGDNHRIRHDKLKPLWVPQSSLPHKVLGILNSNMKKWRYHNQSSTTYFKSDPVTAGTIDLKNKKFGEESFWGRIERFMFWAKFQLSDELFLNNNWNSVGIFSVNWLQRVVIKYFNNVKNDFNDG